MNYENFLTEVKANLESYLAEDNREGTVVIKKVLKNNGVERDAVTIIDRGCVATPTVYINCYYEDFAMGKDIKEIAGDIYKLILENEDRLEIKPEDFCEFEKIKDKIVYKVINTQKNKKLLSCVPHINIMDLSIVFYCLVKCSDGESATTLIYNHQLDAWKINREKLIEVAKANTPKLLPAKIMSMNDILAEMLLERSSLGEECIYDGEEIKQFAGQLMEEIKIAEDAPMMYVLTNNFRINGAATIFYDKILKEFADEHKKDLIIIPSSIHEVILIPIEAKMRTRSYIRKFDSMINEVNYEEVEETDVLSDHAYVYRRDLEKIEYKLLEKECT